MARGKKIQPDFIAAGTTETRGDASDENLSAIDLGMDFSLSVPVVQADINEQ